MLTSIKHHLSSVPHGKNKYYSPLVALSAFSQRSHTLLCLRFFALPRGRKSSCICRLQTKRLLLKILKTELKHGRMKIHRIPSGRGMLQDAPERAGGHDWWRGALIWTQIRGGIWVDELKPASVMTYNMVKVFPVSHVINITRAVFLWYSVCICIIFISVYKALAFCSSLIFPLLLLMHCCLQLLLFPTEKNP